MDEKRSKVSNRSIPAPKRGVAKAEREPNGVMLAGIWMLAISLVLLASYLAWRTQSTRAATPGPTPTAAPDNTRVAVSSNPITAEIPDYFQGNPEEGVSRRTTLHTNIPTRSRTEVIEYSVTTGDSVFGIAQSFNLHPETILWANYDQLNDSPDMLNPGMTLNVPPVDGVYYQVAGRRHTGIGRRKIRCQGTGYPQLGRQ